jgi:hypothetical protein
VGAASGGGLGATEKLAGDAGRPQGEDDIVARIGGQVNVQIGSDVLLIQRRAPVL